MCQFSFALPVKDREESVEIYNIVSNKMFLKFLEAVSWSAGRDYRIYKYIDIKKIKL